MIGKQYTYYYIISQYQIPYYSTSICRIVCDVPCSGEGAIRKIPSVWKSFHPENGIRLHSIQLQIALRGVSLLKIGKPIESSQITSISPLLF